MPHLGFRSAFAIFLLGNSAAPQTTPLDLSNLKPECKPCDDFYQYANGGWISRNPIPQDRSSWSSYDEVAAKTRARLSDIFVEAVAAAERGEQSDFARMGTFYKTCTDVAQADALGMSPIQETIARLAVVDRQSLQDEITKLHLQNVGALFQGTADADARDNTQVLATLRQGGLSFEPSVYTGTNDRSRKMRDQLRQHMARMFEVAGSTPAAAASAADRAMKMEMTLGSASLSAAELRDPEKLYNPKTMAELGALAPGFDWPRYFTSIGASGVQRVNVAHTRFATAASRLLLEAPIEDWRAYLQWTVLSNSAPWLSKKFRDESFAFSASVFGVTQPTPRGEQCIAATNRYMGHAVGRAYADRVYTPETRRRALEMIKNLKAATRERLAKLEWADKSMRRAAIAKLDAMHFYVGHPDRWVDYSPLRIDDGSFYQNRGRAAEFELRRKTAMVGKPLGRELSLLLPQRTSGAYYDQYNFIFYPAAKFQAPFFFSEGDDAINYGALGATISHEIGHGFDDYGRRYDAKGNLRDWWTPEASAQFKQRASKMVAQFDGYKTPAGEPVSGYLTLGENIADLGGLIISYNALQKTLKGKRRTKIDGFTPEQRFFLSWAQNWRFNMRPEALSAMIKGDEHAPAVFRVNGPLSNMPEFAAAFGCKVGDPMVRSPADRVVIW